MSRSERLFALLQVLRRHRRAVSGRALAAETRVSLRTLYRDIASLQALGAAIEGEPGVGYILKPGFLLPPLMFTPEELEALVLGSRWVAERTDGSLAAAAGNALARISAVLPAELQNELAMTTLLIGPSKETPQGRVDLAVLRQAIRQETKLRLVYRDAADAESERLIWPFALAYFDAVRVLLGWCELRQDFRSFRADRIVTAQPSDQRYPQRRQSLLREWRRQQVQRAATPDDC